MDFRAFGCDLTLADAAILLFFSFLTECHFIVLQVSQTPCACNPVILRHTCMIIHD